VAQLDAGARVLAVFRSEDGAFLAVRNPAALPTTVWIAAGSAEVDSGQDVSALPVADCVEGEELVAEPSPVPSETAPAPVETTEAPDNGGNDNPPPPPDTTKPTINVGGWTPGNEICPIGYGRDEAATITVSASDNSGGVSVSGSTATSNVYVSGPSISGNSFTFTVTHNRPSNANVTVVFVATDSAGNTAQANSPVLITWWDCVD
jgi:hypothetical protein